MASHVPTVFKNLKHLSSEWDPEFVNWKSYPYNCKQWFRTSLTQEPRTFNESLRASSHLTSCCLGACVLQLLTSSHVPAMTRTSTHAPRSTPFIQFLTLSTVSTSSIRLTSYAKAQIVPACHADVWRSAGTAPRIPKLSTKPRCAVIFTRRPVRPDKHCRYALDRKIHSPHSPSRRNESNISCLWWQSSPESTVKQ